jgi:hypothetical protein
MKTLTLRRFEQGRDYTLGNLANEQGDFDIFTLEDAWKDNQKYISCIPQGLYRCVPHNGKKYKDVWRLENVPNRTAILIHAGNNVNDTLGCILVGMLNLPMADSRVLIDSRIALKKLKEYIGRDDKNRLLPFFLNVVNLY